MSIKHSPPRQDRRAKGRAPVMRHDGQHSVGTKKTINDPANGQDFDGGSGPEKGSAPGANGPPTTGNPIDG